MLRTALILMAMLAASGSSATEAGWALLREGGHVVLLRHADSVGTDAAAGVEMADCGTRRSLTQRGEQQARKLGALFATRAAKTELVLTSRYCPCRDTARGAFRDNPIEDFAALDPIPGDPEAGKAQLAMIVARAADYRGAGNLVLITHETVIAALTGVAAREAEAVIVAPSAGGLRAIGRIAFN